MQEKKQKTQLVKETDAFYANEIAQRIQSVHEMELQQLRDRKNAKNEYFNTLSTQVKQEKQRKKYDILMTEHERRVHDKNIKAYEGFVDDIQIGGMAKLGQHYTDIQQKYVGKAFGTNSL